MTEQTDSAVRPGCDFCHRFGLPILPVRYAVARTDVGSPQPPEVSGDFLGEPLSSQPLSDGQTYTMRLLREGYLYVFNESGGRWTGFAITKQGYLSKYVDIAHDELLAIDIQQQGPIDGKLQPPPERTEFSCNDNPDHMYPGRCVTVPDAGNADKVYLVYSEVPWTKRVWKEHATNENGRRNQMRAVSLAQWKGGSVRHAGNLNDISRHVAEASWPWSPHPGVEEKSGAGTTEHTPFSFSQYPMNGIEEHVEGLLNWARTQTEESEIEPMILALEDPSGITADLAALMSARNKEFHQQPDIQRRYELKSIIGSIEVAVREQAESDYITKRMDSASRSFDIQPVRGFGPGPRLSAEELEEEREYFDRLRTDAGFYEEEERSNRDKAFSLVTKEQLTNAADEAWEKHKNMLQEGQPEDWYENDYRNAASEYNERVMLPLTMSFLGWFKGEVLLEYLEANFDDKDSGSGEAFCHVVANCLADSQENPKLFDEYKGWIEEAEIRKENLVLRGLSLNLSEVIASINESLADAEGGSNEVKGEYDFVLTLPWSPIISSYKGLTRNLPDAKAAPGRVLAHVFGPALSSLNNRMASPFLAMMGMIEGRPIVYSRVTGTVREAVDSLVDQISALNRNIADIDRDLLRRKLEIHSRGSGRSMTPKGGGEWDISIVMDRLMLADIPEGSDLSSSNKVSQAIISHSDIDLGDNRRALFFGGLSGRETQLGVVGLLLGAWSFNDAAKKLDELSGNGEAAWRFRAAALGMAGAISELVYAVLDRSARVGGLLSQVVRGGARTAFEILGRYSGLGTGMILAVCDGYLAYKSVELRDYTMVGLYGVSAVSTGLSSIALFSASTLAIAASTGVVTVSAALITGLFVVGGVLGVVAVVVAVSVMYFDRSDLQNWLRKCYFGKAAGDEGPENDARFDTSSDELSALRSLLGEGAT